MSKAPIAMFVYNRADHTRATFEALSECPEAKESELFIFSDGAKNEANENKVKEVRDYIRSAADRGCFKNVHINESSTNKGLAASIISGVTEILERYGKIIVLEDDCIASPFFLNYMNNCLEKFQSDKRIGSIAGYSPDIPFPSGYKKDIYLACRSCSWGWATWSDRWADIDWEMKGFREFCRHRDYVKRLNRNGNDRFLRLYRQSKGGGSSWSVRFGAHHAANDWLVVYPRYSYIRNIGCDATGVHSKEEDAGKIAVDLSNSIESPCLELPELDEKIQKTLYDFYSGSLLSRIKKSVATELILLKNV